MGEGLGKQVLTEVPVDGSRPSLGAFVPKRWRLETRPEASEQNFRRDGRDQELALRISGDICIAEFCREKRPPGDGVSPACINSAREPNLHITVDTSPIPRI